MNLLVTGAWSDAKLHIAELEQMGHRVAFMQQESEALPCEAAWVEGVICNALFQFHPIEAFPNLQLIQLTSAGYDRVPMDYVRERGIEIHNAKGVYSVPMAEFVLCGVLQLYKQSRFFCENQKAHKWEKHRGLLELAGKTVGIIGCGDVGQECAKRFAAFGCRVIGVNRTVKELPNFEAVVPLENLDEVLPQCDVVVLTIALTDETRHLMGNEQFAALKDGAVLCNISRGAVVDTAALTEWLHAETSGGAVLDVFEEEPLAADSPLWELDKVIVTPHNSFAGDGDGTRLWNEILSNVGDVK